MALSVLRQVKPVLPAKGAQALMILVCATLAPHGRSGVIPNQPTSRKYLQFRDNGWLEIDEPTGCHLRPAYMRPKWEVDYSALTAFRQLLAGQLISRYQVDPGQVTIEMVTGGNSGDTSSNGVMFWVTLPSGVALDFDLVADLPDWLMQVLPTQTLLDIQFETVIERWQKVPEGV
jgi:hypothetical protein